MSARIARLRDRIGRAPRALRWITLVAVLNTVAWGILVPPFHVPDETAHVAYVQYLAETGRLPKAVTGSAVFSPEINQTLAAIGFDAVVGRTENDLPAPAAERADLAAIEDRSPSRVGSGDVASATNNPPLYYALEAAVYRASPSSDLLSRLALMRLLSALIAGATALFAALFLRELFAATPLAWTAGGLAVAIQPLFGFISSGVTNDVLLYCAAAAVFFGLARMLRRGVTPRRAVFVGLALAAGALAKATLIAFVPAVAFAFVLAIVRAGPGGRRAAVRAVAIGAGAVVAAAVVYAVMSAVIWDRPVWGAAAAAPAPGDAPAAIGSGSFREQFSYVWQLFLPRLGIFTALHPTTYPLHDVWFVGFVGTFGWLDYGFPLWVYDVASAVALLVAALAGATLLRERRALRRHLPELLTYLVAAVGLALLIGLAGYRYWLNTGGTRFEQARYLLPLLPLYGALVALAVRAGGQRAGPALAALAVVIAIGWSVYAQILTALRFYA